MLKLYIREMYAMKRWVIAILIMATAVVAVACSKEEPDIKGE